MEIEKRFKKFKDDLSKSGLKFTGKVVKGDVDTGVKNYSELIGANLITVATTGKDYVSQLILGSNTLKILRSSSIPVLTVPYKNNNTDFKVDKILVPVDISEKNYRSLEYALDIAGKTGSRITILYILAIPHNTNEIPPKVIDEMVKGANDELQELVSDSSEKVKNLSINKKLVIGLSPSKRIIEYAKKNKFNLIVLNSHNRGGIERFFLGSVAEDVIRGSGCPVFTVKPEV